MGNDARIEAIERTIDQELDMLEREARKGGEFVGITNALALRLVHELRVARFVARRVGEG